MRIITGRPAPVTGLVLVAVYGLGLYEANAIQRGAITDDHKGHTAPVVISSTSSISSGVVFSYVTQTIAGPAIVSPPRDTTRTAMFVSPITL
jgi:hypothetical protein